MARAPGTRDYRDGTRKDPEGKSAPVPARSEKSSTQASRRWWTMTGKDCAESISGVVDFLQKRQTNRLRNMVQNARLYGNVGAIGLGSSSFGTLLQEKPQGKKYATYNATQSGIDTMVSHIGETKPRVFYLTSGGDYRQHRQAQKLTQFTDGVFYEAKSYRKGSKSFRDGAVFGDGFIYVFVRGGKICHERTLGSELWVDEVEGQYGEPRNLYRVKVIDRDELKAYCPDKAKEIEAAPRAKETAGSTIDNISDMVTVAECWHLGAPDKKGKLQGGMTALVLVGTGEMLEAPAEWEHDFFPFARFPWCEPLTGYWATGACEQSKGKQLWLNELMWTVQKSMRLAGTIKVAVEHGSKVVDEHINNEIGTVLKHAPGKPPTFFTSSPIDKSFFVEINQTKQDIYQEIGVSELSAGNVKPEGLDSKPSLREFKETQNERHKTKAELYDDFYLQLAHISRSLAAGLKSFTVRVPGATGFKSITVADLGTVKDEDFVLQMFPTSQLPRDPAGATQTVQEWVQAGWLTPRQGRKMMSFPDLQAANTMADAQEEYLLQRLEAIVDDGDYSPPEPTDDLALDKETVLHFIQLYSRLDLEEEKLAMLRTFNSQIDSLIELMTTPAPASMAPGAPSPTGTPQGVPPPAPQAALLPQAA